MSESTSIMYALYISIVIEPVFRIMLTGGWRRCVCYYIRVACYTIML